MTGIDAWMDVEDQMLQPYGHGVQGNNHKAEGIGFYSLWEA